MASGRDEYKLSLGFCSDLSTGQSPVGQPQGLSGRNRKAQGGGWEREGSTRYPGMSTDQDSALLLSFLQC